MGHQSRRTLDSLASAVRPVLQQLESRQLLSVSLENNVLHVTGTEGRDRIYLQHQEEQNAFRVSLNGHRSYFNIADVHEVRVDALGGDDVIAVRQDTGRFTIPVTANGGAGDDTIGTGAGDDRVDGGAGDDLIVGGWGEDVLVGGTGNDSVIGGHGKDRLFGRQGADELDGMVGEDAVVGGDGKDVINAVRYRFPLLETFTPQPTAYEPRQIRQAYALGDLTDKNFTNRGQGAAIAIVGAYSIPRARQDLAVFARQFGLPGLSSKALKIVDMARKGERLYEEGWNAEALLDLQAAHMIAPRAKIYMVQARSNSAGDLHSAVDRAKEILNNNHNGGVISMSWGVDVNIPSHRSFEAAFKGRDTKNISFIVAAPDFSNRAGYPETSPNVTTVGGTTLYLDEQGNRVAGFRQAVLDPDDGLPIWVGDLDGPPLNVIQTPGGEKAWISTGGGFSTVFEAPDYQDARGIGPMRGIPDVAWNADPRTGVAVFNSMGFGGGSGWSSGGGNSAGAPQFAGLVALVNQLRKEGKKAPIGRLNENIYRLAGTGTDDYFNDITSGFSGTNVATGGWDPVTGWGTPNGRALIPALAGQKPRYNEFIRGDEVLIRARFSRLDTSGITQESYNFRSIRGDGQIAGNSLLVIPALVLEPFPSIPTGGTVTDQELHIFGQDEVTGDGDPFYIRTPSVVHPPGTVPGTVVQVTTPPTQIATGGATPVHLHRNGNTLTGYGFYSYRITTTGQGATTAITSGPVKFVGTIRKGKVSGRFFAVDAEGKEIKFRWGGFDPTLSTVPFPTVQGEFES